MLPGCDRDACFVPTIVICRVGGVVQRNGARIYYFEA